MQSLEPQEQHWLESFRRDIHKHPEIGLEEHRTSQKVTEALEDCTPDHSLALAGTGRLFIFGRQGPMLMIRAELDALPLKEVNPDLPYASSVKGKGHLCGHDGHMTMLVGLARKLAQKPLEGKRIALLFQPAEETGQGGPEVVKDPIFQKHKPDAAIALHNIPGNPLGEVRIKDGAFTPASLGATLFLEGKTSHAAEPHKGINPALAMAQIAIGASKMVQPDISKADFSLLTPVEIQMGSKAFGTSAGEGFMRYTLRTLDNEGLESLQHRFLEMAQKEAQKAGLAFAHTQEEIFFANTNAPYLCRQLRETAAGLHMPLRELEVPYPWCEDFGAITQEVPGMMFGLGSGENQPALHNPDFNFPDALLGHGIALFYAFAQQWNPKA